MEVSKYRPDIDGLRSIAVLSVLFYHFRLGPFTGGYVGVDIFFVISGFLITSIIHTELLDNNFSFWRFYERRVRRIFPALIALLIFTTAAAAFVLFPFDLIRYGKSLAGTAVFASNMEFWHEAGYFDASADTKPLLHTWSLAIEEQYYLIFPTLLFVMKRASRTLLFACLGIVFLLSFLCCVWLINLSPVSAFYLLPSRFWELLMGAMLAIGRFPAPRTRISAHSFGIAGGALIAWSVFAFTPTTVFPGWNALLPCMGAALIIFAGQNNHSAVNRLLATRPFVFVGLISYSLYLWHWPIYVFGKYLGAGDVSLAAKLVQIALAFLAAWLSWRFVERPFRGKSGIMSRPVLFASSFSVLGALTAIAVAMVIWHGLPQRYPAPVQTILAAANDRDPLKKTCFNLRPEKIRKSGYCVFGAPGKKPDFALWGDSHSEAELPAFITLAQQEGRAGIYLGSAGCPPLIGAWRADQTSSRCVEFNGAALEAIHKRGLKEVVLAARWAKDAEGTRYGQDEGLIPLMLADAKSRGAWPGNNHDVFARSLDRTIAALHASHIAVLIVGPVPEVGLPVPQTVAKLKTGNISFDPRPTKNAFMARQKFVLEVLADIERRYGARIVYPSTVLCPGERCAIEADGYPLYVDSHHLSTHGAAKLVPLLKQAF